MLVASNHVGVGVAEIDAVARELVLLLRSLKGMHRTVLADAGLRLEMPASAVLATLQEHGPQRVSALAEALHVDLSSASRQVTALERDGLVGRTRDPDDSRAALVDLTADGRQALADLRAARLAHLAQRLPGWSDQELRHFAALLHRFRTDLTAPDPASSTPASRES